MATMRITTRPCRNAHDAIQMADAGGWGTPVLLEGEAMLVKDSDVERLELAGVEFSLLHNHQMQDGEFRIVGVPVNS